MAANTLSSRGACCPCAYFQKFIVSCGTLVQLPVQLELLLGFQDNLFIPGRSSEFSGVSAQGFCYAECSVCFWERNLTLPRAFA